MRLLLRLGLVVRGLLPFWCRVGDYLFGWFVGWSNNGSFRRRVVDDSCGPHIRFSEVMQQSVFDCLLVFVVMDNCGLKWLIAAWLESVEKVWTLQNLAADLLCLEDDVSWQLALK